MLSNKSFFAILMIAILVVGIFRTVKADSVYVINDTDTKQIQAYEIDGSDLIYQQSYSCNETGGGGAVGIAIDDSHDGQFLFVTFEGGNHIELVNAKTMEYVDTVIAPQADDLSGGVVDVGRRKVYIIDRRTNHLYVYSWSATDKELTLDFPAPYYVELEDCYQGYGLAYDEDNDRLFVGDNTATVKYYDPNDWSKIGEFEVLHTAVGIAVDVENQYVYTGSSQFGNNNYLCRHALNVSDPCDVDYVVNVESPVLGIAVDQDTSLVYVTTYGTGNPQTQDRLMVYAPFDPNNPEDPNMMSLMWKSGDIGNPAGVAVASGVGYKPPRLHIEKTSNVELNDCVSPEAEDPNIVYTIIIDPNGYDATEVLITDYLPLGVDYISADPEDEYFGYDSFNHTYTWYRAFIGANDPAEELKLLVRVTDRAMPGGTIINEVEIESQQYFNYDSVENDVCCWGGDIIYVDARVGELGYNNGTSWTNAYTDVQSALERAADGCGREIWIAEGTYSPENEEDKTFDMVEGVAIYGGFAGNETDRDQRDWIHHQTILTGSGVCNAVVTADGVHAVLNGCIIEDAVDCGVQCKNDANLHVEHCTIRYNAGGGIHANGGDPNVSDCTIHANFGSGVYCSDSAATINHCLIEGNSLDGVRAVQAELDLIDCVIRENAACGLSFKNDSHTTVQTCLIEQNDSCGIDCQYFNSECSLAVSCSKIRSNGGDGIYCYNSQAAVQNSWIHHNGGDGIFLYCCDGPEVDIRNNTIVYNLEKGILRTIGSDSPTVKNNILWGNNVQLYGTIDSSYCCIAGVSVPNDDHNIDDDPCFAYEEPNSFNFHLHPESPCIDAGNSDGIETGETDIDGDDRVIDDETDMGADECACEDVSNEADFNGDGMVNLLDYALLAAYWLTDDSESNWPSQCDLVADGEIDLLDVAVFCDSWPWTACYYVDDWYAMEMAMSGGSGGFARGGLKAAGRISAMEPMAAKPLPHPAASTTAASARQVEPVSVEEMWELVHWLEELRQTYEQVKEIPEDEWQDFMKRVYLTFEYLE